MPGDEEIAQRVHVLGRPVIVAVNKTDDKAARSRAVEFYKLGFEPVLEVSAEHGDGVYELLDEILGRLPDGQGAGRAGRRRDRGRDRRAARTSASRRS